MLAVYVTVKVTVVLAPKMIGAASRMTADRLVLLLDTAVAVDTAVLTLPAVSTAPLMVMDGAAPRTMQVVSCTASTHNSSYEK